RRRHPLSRLLARPRGARRRGRPRRRAGARVDRHARAVSSVWRRAVCRIRGGRRLRGRRELPAGRRLVTIRVLGVDAQPLGRSGLRMVLDERPDIELVGEAADGNGALELAAALDPDVVLMDIRMPNLDGVEATRRLVAAETRARILVLTTFDLDEYVYAAIDAGASGFLLKDVQPTDLIDAIRVVAAGNSLFALRRRSGCSRGTGRSNRVRRSDRSAN